MNVLFLSLDRMLKCNKIIIGSYWILNIVFFKLPVENIYRCVEFNLVAHVNIEFAQCFRNIICCSIVLKIVLLLCSVTKANEHLKVY